MKERIRKIIRFETAYAGHELFVVVGLLMVITTLLKLTGVVYLDSDWYWFIAGLGLIIEGMIMISKQKKFNKKYKIIERTEESKV